MPLEKIPRFARDDKPDAFPPPYRPIGRLALSIRVTVVSTPSDLAIAVGVDPAQSGAESNELGRWLTSTGSLPSLFMT